MKTVLFVILIIAFLVLIFYAVFHFIYGDIKNKNKVEHYHSLFRCAKRVELKATVGHVRPKEGNVASYEIIDTKDEYVLIKDSLGERERTVYGMFSSCDRIVFYDENDNVIESVNSEDFMDATYGF